jgi:uncharacterized protein (TIGR02118 family)
MVTLSFRYKPNVKFDDSYYLLQHMAMAGEVMESLGIRHVEVQQALGEVNGGKPSYHVYTTLYFHSEDALRGCLASPVWKAAVEDIRNYYEENPEFIVAEVVWEASDEGVRR